MSHILKDNQEPESGAVNRGISSWPVTKYAKDNAGRIIALVIVALVLAFIFFA